MADLVRKHLPKSIPTVLGHQHQQRQNIRTTHPVLASTDDDLNPVPEHANTATHLVFTAITTLNLLRTYRLNARLSAKEHLNGTFNFNRTPLAPLGTKVILHETPQQRRTWAPHGVEGWYVGYAPEHYRCYTIHVTRTNKTRIGSTVEFFPTHCQMPHTSTADHRIRRMVPQ
jgi:hypothetical protein